MVDGIKMLLRTSNGIITSPSMAMRSSHSFNSSNGGLVHLLPLKHFEHFIYLSHFSSLRKINIKINEINDKL